MGDMFKKLLDPAGLFNGQPYGGSSSSGGGGGGNKTKDEAKKLFTPEQVSKVQKDYTTQGTAKWNQILSNMGAGGGTGNDFSTGIASQADSLGKSLGDLTTNSGYGNDGMSKLSEILKSVEGGIGAKYPVY